MANPGNPGDFDSWISDRISFTIVEPAIGNTGGWETQVTDRIPWWEYVETPEVPPVPPVPVAPTVGVKPRLGIPKARYALWRLEIREWWRDYFRDAFGILGDELEEAVDERIQPHTINVDEDDEELINML